MIKKHYLLIALLVLAALVAGYFLMPRQQEVALMQMKDKRFAEALANYESQLAQGNLSKEVVTRLAELYLQTGAVDKAIEVTEKYIAANPTDLDAREKVGVYYQYAQRQDDYLRNLEEINKLKPQTENLKILSDIYNFNTQYDKQADALKKLIESEKGANGKNFMDLAYIFAAQKSYPEAITTLQGYKVTHPEEFKFPQTELLVTLLFDDKRPDEALKEADSYLKANPEDFNNNARLINIVHFRGSPVMAQTLMAQFNETQINGNPQLLEEYILLMLADGKDDEAYQKLKGLYAKDALTPELKKRLMFFAIVRDEEELAKTLLASTELKGYSEAELTSLVELSSSQNAPWILAKLNETFPEAEYEGTYPVLMALLSVSNKKADADAKLAKLDGLEISGSQMLQIARVCVRNAKYPCADRFITKLPPAKELSDAEVASVGNLYLDMGQFDKGSKYMADASQGRNSLEIDQVMVKYDAVAGRTDKVETWLTAHKDKLGGRAIADIFFLALNNKQYPTAVAVGEFYNNRDNTSLSRSYLSQAYIRTGQYADAVKLLRDVNPMSEDDENNYLTALSKLSATNADYRRELTDFAALKMRSNISQKQKMAIVYALVQAKQTNVVMPYIRELAMKEGGQWAYLYAENLDKQGKYAESRQFWVQLASQARTSPKEKRQIGYTLLNNGYKDDAVNIFAQLAAKEKPDSTAVKELVYLWGPRPNMKAMQWLESRYVAASGAEKTQWANIIASHTPPAELGAFVKRHPESTTNPTLLSSYMQNMVTDGSFKKESAGLITAARDRRDIPWLMEYARVANENGMYKEARSAYESVIMIDPTNEKALRESGVIAFGQADYSASELLLGQYLQSSQITARDERAYLALFHYGELMRRNHQLEGARAYYMDAIANIDRFHSNTPDAQSIKAQSLIWAGQPDKGFALFNQLRAADPSNDTVRGDQVAALTEIKHYDDARNLLALPILTKNAKGQGTVTLPAAAGKSALTYTILPGDSELLVGFPPSRDPETIARLFLDQPWVSNVDFGYDRLIVSARPGYKLQLNNNVVTAIADNNVSAMTGDKQTILRYELLAARIDVETGRVYEAASRLNDLLPQYKDDAQLMGFVANVENYGGNWPRAQQLIQTAREISPDNEDLAKLDRDMRRLNAANIKGDFEWIKRGRNQEYVTTTSGYVNATSNVIVGAELQRDDLKTRNVRRASGAIGNFDTTRYRGELYALIHGENGQQAKLSLYGNNDTLGLGGVFTFLNTLGETSLFAEYHKSYWDYVEAVLDSATRDRLAIEHTIRPSTELMMTFGPNVNRYNVADANDVLTTAGGTFQISYRLQDSQPSLAVGYSFDAEYELDRKNNSDSNGAINRMFPLRTRELHFVSLSAGYEFSEQTYGDFLVGYAYDRFGGHGPGVEARLTHELTDSLDVQLRAFFGLDARGNTSDNLTRIGAYIRWRF